MEINVLGIIIVLIVVGVVLWLVNSLIPMQPQIKTIVNAFVVLVLVLWLLSLFWPGTLVIRK